MWETLSKLRDETFLKLDTKRLELRISNYSKELSKMYIILGENYYNAKKGKTTLTEIELNELLEKTDTIRKKINYLGKNISEKKNKSEISNDNKQVSDFKEQKSYATLKRSQDDFIIKRTAEGIKFLKFCPKCNFQNSSEQEICIDCGYEFSEKND